VVAAYEDHGISGAKGRERRPQFDRMLKDALRGKFDILAAWAVDRLGRSLQDLVGPWANFERRASTSSCTSKRWTQRPRAAGPCSGC
jgi:Resolvase, N terminal domain